jgi:hypothetical protein
VTKLVAAVGGIALSIWSALAWAPPGSYSGNVEANSLGAGAASGSSSLETLLLGCVLGVGLYLVVWYASARFGIIWLPILMVGGYLLVALLV